jgi:chromate transport protein ChrA
MEEINAVAASTVKPLFMLVRTEKSCFQLPSLFFLPTVGVLLIFGVLPFWKKFRSNKTYRRALSGLNSAAVGLIFASVLSLFLKVRTPCYSTIFFSLFFPSFLNCCAICICALKTVIERRRHPC